MKNRIADLEKLLREAALKYDINLKEKILLPYLDERGTQHYIIPDLLFDENDVKIAIEIGGEYTDREKAEKRNFKEQILKKMGYTVVALDIEKGHEDQVDAFVAELRWLILERQGTKKVDLPEYLTSSFSLKDKLEQKIQQRKNEEQKDENVEMKKIKSAANPEVPSEIPRPKAEKEIVSLGISVVDLMNGKKIEPEKENPAEKVAKNQRQAKKFPLFMAGIGGIIFGFFIFGAFYFQGLPRDGAAIRQFSADLFATTELHPTLSDLSAKNGAGQMVFQNESSQSITRKLAIEAPANSTFIEYKGMYFFICNPGFQKSADGKSCAPSETLHP